MWLVINLMSSMKLTLLIFFFFWMGCEIVIVQLKMYYTAYWKPVICLLWSCYHMHTAIYVNICTSLRCAVGTVLNAPNCISMLRNVSYTMRKFHWVCREASTYLSPKILTKCVFYENFTVNRRSDFSKAKEGSTVV